MKRSRSRIVKIFLIEYQDGTGRRLHEESLTAAIALALGRELARRGRRPLVRRLDVPQADLYAQMPRYEFIAAQGAARSL